MSLIGNPVKIGDGPASVTGDENRRMAVKIKVAIRKDTVRISIKSDGKSRLVG